MKKLFSFTISFLLFSAMLFAQTPQSFQYQAVVRDASGNVLQSVNLNFKLSVILGPLPGTIEYIETHTATTNTFGIVTLAVGSGTPFTNLFSDVDWSNSPKFLKVEADLGGGYINMGTTQLLSVPYAIYAEQAGNAQTYTAGNGMTLTGNTFNAQTTSALWNANQIQNISVSSTAPTTNQILKYDGTNWSLDVDLNTGTPGGLNKTVQFNNSGSFGGDTAMIWDNANKRLGVGITNPTGRMVVQGSLTASDTLPLFEVKNKTGQTIFVVYPDSVHVYVKDNGTKSNQGGFAVSGRNSSKALTNNFLRITPDSTRIYLKENISGGGFAIEGITSNDSITNYLNVSVDTTEIINPSQARILWYPTKEAFLTGRVLIENKDSVGVNSFASGFESKAIGKQSQALGFNPVARGDYSAAIGKNVQANGENSFAFGDSAIARSKGSFSFGYKSEAIGIGSLAFGSAEIDELGVPTGNYTKAEGNYSFALGFGAKTTPLGIGSISMGMGSISESFGSVAFGVLTKAQGKLSAAIGYNSVSTGNFSLAIGVSDTSSGINSFSMGIISKASGNSSMAIGNHAVASGLLSASIGFNTLASGDNSLALGRNVSTNNKAGSTIIGDASTIITTNNTNPNQFMIRATGGYVFYSDPSLMEMNTVYISTLTGNLGLGTSTPARKLHIKDVMRLEPRATPPFPASEGDIYYSSPDHKLKVYNGTQWMDCY